MANWLESITKFLTEGLSQPDVEPRLPTVLAGLEQRLQELQVFSSGLDGSGVDQWLAKLNALIADQEVRDSLLIRALQMRLPRLTEALTALGIIEFQFEQDNSGVHSLILHRARLDRLLTDPGGYAADASPMGGLGTLLQRVQKIKDVKALQVLVMLLIASPYELLKLDYRKEGFLALPFAGDPGVTLQELMDLVNSPLRLALPFHPPLTLDQIQDLADLAAEGEDGYLALLGPDGDLEDPAAGLQGLGIELHLKDPQATAKKSFDLGDGWRVAFAASGNAPTTYRLVWDGNKFSTNPDANGNFEITLAKKGATGGDAVMVGAADSTHFKIQAAQFGLRLRADGALFDLIAQLIGIKFSLKPEFLGFLSLGLNLPPALVFDSDVGMSYVQGQGLTGQGSAGGPPALGVQFAEPLNLKLGSDSAGLQVDQVVVRLEATTGGGSGLRYRAMMRYGARARMGPIRAVMEGAGTWIGRWHDGTAGLLPPEGIGISLEAGPINGGGFLLIVGEREFAGALQLKILGIGAFAYGLFKVLPDGAPSFVALIGIRLPPPGVQLGFGFAVSGFGGLVGIHRRADTDRIRERLASGAAGNVLFNDNPVQNAPRLLGDMQAFFPDDKGIFLIGPTLQINWLYLLRLDVAVVIELPGPRKIFIAGSARMVIGSEEFALIYLRMDFVGGVDLVKRLIFFDAALVNSHMLGVFRITGGVALRIAYGDNGYFLFSVGGFHPSFNPGALELPRLARAGTALDVGIAWLKFETYLALTSNTFQFGSRVEAGVQIGPIAAHGWFGFDALVQFEPFHFVARIDAGFDVEVEGVSLCGVRVQGDLVGPGPLVLRAQASVEVLFIDISKSVTITLNDSPSDARQAIPNVLEHLKDELSRAENLRAEGQDNAVLLAPPTGNVPANLIAPLSALVWEQKRAPLNVPIQRLDGVELGAWHTLRLTSGDPREQPEEDWFGVGTYLELSDAEALNNARFAKQRSGLRVAVGTFDVGATKDATIKIQLVKIEAPVLLWFAPVTMLQYVLAPLAYVLSERAGGARPIAEAPRVSVKQEIWNTHSADGVFAATDLNSVQAFAQVKQFGGVAVPAQDQAVNLAGVM